MHLNQQESGRSMVEMLGVLAVVGVLSVAGIAGYTSAMNQHRANEIVNEAQKRAVVVAMQVAQGRSDLSVAEFADTKYGVTNTGLTGQFAITVDGVDTAVCQKILNAIGDSTQVRYMALKGTPQTKITACSNGSTDYALVYNSDLSVGDAGGYNPNSPEVQACVANGCEEPNRCLPNGEE